MSSHISFDLIAFWIEEHSSRTTLSAAKYMHKQMGGFAQKVIFIQQWYEVVAGTRAIAIRLSMQRKNSQKHLIGFSSLIVSVFIYVIRSHANISLLLFSNIRIFLRYTHHTYTSIHIAVCYLSSAWMRYFFPFI